MLYHIVKPAYWYQCQPDEAYVPETFADEGFIHLSTREQVAGVLERYYSGIRPLIALHLDEALFTAELRYEPAASGELFPHLYGPLNRDAIIGTEEL